MDYNEKFPIILYGIVSGGEDHCPLKIEVAIFSTIEKAEQYVENSRLKNYICGPKKFKDKSVLSTFDDYQIDDTTQYKLPEDPTI